MDERPDLLVLAQALADPLRLAILLRLMEGPAAVTELMALTAAAQSRVSNHLAVLRERGMVRASRLGRQSVYELHSPAVAQLIEALGSVGSTAPQALRPNPPLAKARTCYDHLAGQFGVAVFDALVAQGAVAPPIYATGRPVGQLGVLEIGPHAPAVFARLGIDLADLAGERRPRARACLDWTERRPHLGGALGAALWRQVLEQGWAVRQQGSRMVVVTAQGRHALRQRLGIELADQHLAVTVAASSEACVHC